MNGKRKTFFRRRSYASRQSDSNFANPALFSERQTHYFQRKKEENRKQNPQKKKKQIQKRHKKK